MISSLLNEVMQRFSYGEPVYLRTITVSGGNSALHISGYESVVDTLVVPRPSISRQKVEEALADGVVVSKFRVLFLFNDTITQEVALAATGVLIGSKYCAIEHGSDVLLYTDNDVASGIEMVVAYRGKIA